MSGAGGQSAGTAALSRDLGQVSAWWAECAMRLEAFCGGWGWGGAPLGWEVTG